MMRVATGRLSPRLVLCFLLLAAVGGAGCIRRPAVRVRVEDGTRSIFLVRALRLFPEGEDGSAEYAFAMDEGVGELSVPLDEPTFFRLMLGEELGSLDVLLSPLDSLRLSIAPDGTMEASGSYETARWRTLQRRYEAYRDSLRVLRSLYTVAAHAAWADSLRALYAQRRRVAAEDMRRYLLWFIHQAPYSKLAIPALLAERDEGEPFFSLLPDSALFARVQAAQHEVYNERAYLARLDSALARLQRVRSHSETDSLRVERADSLALGRRPDDAGNGGPGDE
ncbi:MAG: hypothetical protein CSA07_00370 [Bacteroidia bacterium]|nr:MAG: hypothetical protein CSA07_00370 [Bacteroidia bacterium]